MRCSQSGPSPGRPRSPTRSPPSPSVRPRGADRRPPPGGAPPPPAPGCRRARRRAAPGPAARLRRPARSTAAPAGRGPAPGRPAGAATAGRTAPPAAPQCQSILSAQLPGAAAGQALEWPPASGGDNGRDPWRRHRRHRHHRQPARPLPRPPRPGPDGRRLRRPGRPGAGVRREVGHPQRHQEPGRRPLPGRRRRRDRGHTPLRPHGADHRPPGGGEARAVREALRPRPQRGPDG